VAEARPWLAPLIWLRAIFADRDWTKKGAFNCLGYVQTSAQGVSEGQFELQRKFSCHSEIVRGTALRTPRGTKKALLQQRFFYVSGLLYKLQV